MHRSYPGATYHSAYEAGFCGLLAHHRLQSLGIDNMVVNAAGTLTPIYTPSERTLNDRSLIRFRKTLTQDMGRFKTRIKSFLYFFGVELPDEFKDPNKHWSKRFMDWLEGIQMKEPSGKQALTALVLEAQAQRELIKNVTKEINRFANAERFASFIGLTHCQKDGKSDIPRFKI